MPYAPEHRQRTKERIVRTAQVLFNRRGFDGTSIDQIMADVGLTRGGFYEYFKTKSELYAAAIALSLSEPATLRLQGVSVDFTAKDAARQVIRAYLSRQHFEDIDASCPMVGLPSDTSRSDPTVRRVFEEVFKGMVGLFHQSLDGPDNEARERALAMAAICVGGMVIARAVEDRALADSLRDAAMKVALELGGWSSTPESPLKSDPGKEGAPEVRPEKPYDSCDVADRIRAVPGRKS